MAYGTNAPFGLQPRYKDGTTWNGQTTPAIIKSGFATSLFKGDPIVSLADGSIGIATSVIRGIFWGCKYKDSNGEFVTAPFWPANTITLDAQDVEALIITDPNLYYDIQVSNSQNVADPTIPAVDINLNADFAVAGGGANLVPQNPTSGSTRTGQSAYYLDFNTLATTATLSLKIMRITPVIGNIAGIPFNNVMVTLNNNDLKGGTGTAGV